MCFTSKSLRPEPDMLDARTAQAPRLAREWTGQLAGEARGAWGCRRRLGVLSAPGAAADAARRDARSARRPRELGQQS